MATEIFSKEEFEAALPVAKVSGDPMWEELGLVDGEYAYNMPVTDDVAIVIRSSVRSNGYCAETGKDSIRAWLTRREDGSPLGSKMQAYVTRVTGWADRMRGVLVDLYRRGQNVPFCPDCGIPMGIYKVKKEGKNKGRLFVKCWDHGHFSWLDSELKAISPIERKAEAPRWEVPGPEDVADLLSGCTTIQARVESLRTRSKTDQGVAVFMLMEVYGMQTEAEKALERTTDYNNVGFTGVDAEFFSSLAKQFVKKGRLSVKQMASLFKGIGRYSVQIERQVIRPELAG